MTDAPDVENAYIFYEEFLATLFIKAHRIFYGSNNNKKKTNQINNKIRFLHPAEQKKNINNLYTFSKIES